MSSVWGMILQWHNTIKISTEHPVATRHRRDMTEKLLKATLKPEQTTTTKQGMCSLYWSFSLYKPDAEVWSTRFVQLSALGSWDSGFESLLRHIFHLTERCTRRLTCVASDVRDTVRNLGQDNVTNINTGSGVRRIIFTRQQCMYKSEQWYINENLLTQNARARPHTAFLWLFSRDYNLKF